MPHVHLSKLAWVVLVVALLIVAWILFAVLGSGSGSTGVG